MTVTMIALAAVLAAVLVTLFLVWRDRGRIAGQVDRLSKELIEVSADASVGRRLSARGAGSISDLANTINQLFDAIGERDEEIQDRDQLFADFSRTLPEIVLVHDERILLANDSAAGLIGLEARAVSQDHG
jgi:PAS domain-containing protein